MKLYDALILDPVLLLENKEVDPTLEYERKVINSIKAAGIPGNITEPAGNDSNKVDADFNIKGVIHPLEIKYTTNSFLYSGGIRYDMETGQFSPSDRGKESADAEKMKMFKFVANYMPHLNDLKPRFNKIISYIISNMPSEANERKKISKGFPIQSTDAIWNKLIANDLTTIGSEAKLLNMDIFSMFYTKLKNVNYIQIGGHGLFYLINNPANLPIPKLEGNIQLELKWKTGGLKKDRKIPTRTIGIEIIGRFKNINQSQYTMDDPESIKNMLQNVL